MDKPSIKAPGLKWRGRKNRWVPVWVARDDAVRAGYPEKTVNLEPLLDGRPLDDALLRDRCRALQEAMLLWLSGYRKERVSYDGTLEAVLRLYETHPDSPFRKLKPGSRVPYLTYLKKLYPHVGGRHVSKVT